MDIMRRLIDTLIFGLVLASLGLCTAIFARINLIDWQQATSMLWVEAVVGILLFIFNLLWRDKEAERFGEAYAKRKQEL